MTDAGLLQAAQEDFRQRRGDAPFVSPLPPSRRQPLGLDEHFIKTGDEELFSNLIPSP